MVFDMLSQALPLVIHLLVSLAFSVLYVKVLPRKPFVATPTLSALLGDAELVKLILVVNLAAYAVALLLIKWLAGVDYGSLRQSSGSSIHLIASLVIYVQARYFHQKAA